MRKNSPRKWLHACLDLLPVILIPVFMIYSHRHDVSTTTTYTEQVPVYYETNEVNDYNDLLVGNIYHWGDNQGSIEGLTTNYFLFTIKPTENLYFVPNLENTSEIILYINSNGISMRVTYNDSSQLFPSIKYITFDFVIDTIQSSISYANYVIGHISESEMLLVKDFQTITYDFDKDIMGAFMNNFNFTIDKYFNMGNVFNLGDVYQWFNTNIFGGNAPVVIQSIYNIVIYELVMDLLFLLYGLFMWFIDIIQHLMDKPFKTIK